MTWPAIVVWPHLRRVHSTPVTLAPGHSANIPQPSCLWAVHLLFPLPEVLSPQITTWPTPSLPPGVSSSSFFFLKYCFVAQFFKNLFIYIFSWPCHAACGILVPQPGNEPAPPALEAWSLNHWTAGQVPLLVFLNMYLLSESFPGQPVPASALPWF